MNIASLPSHSDGSSGWVPFSRGSSHSAEGREWRATGGKADLNFPRKEIYVSSGSFPSLQPNN